VSTSVSSVFVSLQKAPYHLTEVGGKPIAFKKTLVSIMTHINIVTVSQISL